MKFKMLSLSVLIAGMLLVLTPAYAGDAVLTEQSIHDLYRDLVESKTAGGSYLISIHEKHYHDDLSMILNLERNIGGSVMPRSFLDYGKVTLMDAIKSNTEIIDHKYDKYEIIDLSIDEGGRRAQAHVKIESRFIVQLDKLVPQRKAFETLDCQDGLILSDSNVVQIISSKCDVSVFME